MGIGTVDSKGYPLEFALYLEGVRVPFQKAVVSANVNQPVTCSIDLPPFTSATRIRPKTLVHIFYLDAPFVNSENTAQTPTDPQWRLLFEGEVTHLRVTQTDGAKSVTLICQDFTNYWFHAFQYFLNNQRPMSGAQLEIATFVNGLGSSQEPLIKLAEIHNVAFAGRTGDFVLNTILTSGRQNAFIGLFDLLNKIKDINKFFSDAVTRLKLFKKVFMLPDAQLTKLLLTKAASASFKHMAQFTGSLGNTASVYQVIQRFLTHAFYEYISMPAPSYGNNPTVDISAAGVPGGLPNTLDGSEGEVPLQTMFKPRTTFCPAPLCNVFFPSKINSFSYTRSFLDETTRLRLKLEQGLSTAGNSVNPSTIMEMAIYAPLMISGNAPYPGLFGTTGAPTDDNKEVKKSKEAATIANATTNPAAITTWQAILREYGFYPDGSNLLFDPTRDISEPETGILPGESILDINQAIIISELQQLSEADKKKPLAEQLTIVANLDTQSNPDTVTDENARNRLRYYVQVADYQLDLKRYGQRAVDGIKGPFNPNLLLGFPAVVLETPAFLLGDLTSITHIIDANVGATTECVMTFARSLPAPTSLSGIPIDGNVIAAVEGNPGFESLDLWTGINMAEVRSPVDGATTAIKDRKSTDFPVFLNSKFKPTNISSTYFNTFGTLSIFDKVKENTGVAGVEYIFQGSTPDASVGDQYKACTSQFISYVAAKDKVSFVNKATGRRITSITNLRNHYGFSSPFVPALQNKMFGPGYGRDEFLFDNSDLGPIFREVKTGVIATKQKIILDLTTEIRASLGIEQGTNIFGTDHQKKGGVSGT